MLNLTSHTIIFKLLYDFSSKEATPSSGIGNCSSYCYTNSPLYLSAPLCKLVGCSNTRWRSVDLQLRQHTIRTRSVDCDDRPSPHSTPHQQTHEHPNPGSAGE